MGLLTLFSKKSHSDLAQRDTLKTSAYDATVALEPPIRGTYPVLGNGSKILEQFQKSHPNLTTISHNNSPTLSPLVSRLRRNGPYGSDVERPRTAPSSQSGGATGPSSLQSQPTSELPPLPKKKYGPYKLPPKLATDIQLSSPSARPTPSPGLASIYSDSIRSSQSGKPRGYVDLLDAQSRFKPSDFYGRIQATGAKNYGEDVADRNRLEKPTDLEKRKSQESLTNHEDARWSQIISKDVDDDTDNEPPRRPRIRHSISSGLRSKHSRTRTLDPYPKRTSSRLPPNDSDEMPKAMSRTASARSERAARRKSMPSFATSASADPRRSSSAARRGGGKDTDIFPDSLRDRARAATMHEREQTKPNISSKRQSLASSHVENQTRQKRSDLEKPLPALPPSFKDPSRRRSTTQHNVLVESRLLVKRQSLQGIQSPTRGEIYEDTYQQKISLQGAQLPRDRISARRQLGSTTDFQDSFYKASAQQPDHKSQIIASPAKYTDNKGKPRQSKHIRKQSMISLSSKSITAHDIQITFPERASSRHWSLTSETAMSTLSSNPFRPQSGHTTSTSIDFSPMFPHAHPDLTIPPVPDISFLKSLQSMPRKTRAMSSPTPSLTSTHKRQSSEFYLEDHVSNDGSTTPSRGSYEKDLLFTETDYSLSGNQISGLPGLFDATIPVSSPTPDVLTIRALERDPHNVSGPLHFSAFPSDDSDDSFANREQRHSSDAEINFDIPMSRPRSMVHHTSAQEQLPTRQQPFMEEDDSDY
ncbi:hypothetical protein F4803DRAFT_160845 [Xylaria telfairii]|nr:hypothetical protein F4803DRAFT_160845 [Xylaria telfairii]